ncbi:hypothetical protein EAX61_09160 [Dokdonia sinensis]|uniref:Lipocalin-like domain-containing protein n=1 Tax=Dokdonia sinensis TaxID=2479847 RepID=A0A3M0GCD8_9FLAO|nr:lipocalin family protein [Dokdonia sinensis]RMB59213.1 hypothetical protein EAX61_09160 [Dokdonia sinensis]
MKNVFMALCVVFLLGSCGSDDDASQANAGLEGSWELTAYTLAAPQDLNGDGEPSTDVLEELPCFDAAITFRGDGSFTSTTDGFDVEIDVNSGTFFIVCGNPTSLDGTWSLDGDVLTTVSEGETDSAEIDLDGNTFSFDDEAAANDTMVSGRFTFTRQ